MGAWVETLPNDGSGNESPVAPYVGAWVETFILRTILILVSSHLTWVRGLKHSQLKKSSLSIRSHLTWVRGLKPVSLDKDYFSKSRTLRGCVG